MKKIIPFILLLLLSSNIWGQSNDLSKDNSKSLTLNALISLTSADLLTIDKALSDNDYVFNEGVPASDFVSYKYVRNNFFFFKRFITKQTVIYKFGYTDGLYSKYNSEIATLGLQLAGSPSTVLIDNGIKSSYEDATKTWLITLSKVNAPGGATIEISISPHP